MKDIASTVIAAMNALSGDGGLFFAAASVTVEAGTTLYLADVQEPFTFEGHVYQPRPLRFEGLGQTSQQSLPSMTVVLNNIDGVVGVYLEANDVVGLPVTLMILHQAATGIVSAAERVRLTIGAADSTWEVANVRVSLDLALSEVLPRTLYSAETESGVPEGLRRASIL